MNLKTLIGLSAIFLTFTGYVPYIRDTITGKTRPHVYTWFLWVLVSCIACALQFSDGAGIGAGVTATAVVVCFFIACLGLRNGKRDIKASDTIFAIAALLAIPIWLFARQPVVSVILLSSIEMLAFIPTLRKSWNDPYSETLASYAINTLRFGLALFALAHYSIITTLYPATWLVGNGIFSVFLIIRRRQAAVI